MFHDSIFFKLLLFFSFFISDDFRMIFEGFWLTLGMSSPYSKNFGRRYSPQGGFNPPPYGVGVLNGWSGVSGFFFPDSSSRRFCLPPPKSSPSSLGPTPSGAAKNGAGASWRLLGRKNRVPRGLQKLIKF